MNELFFFLREILFLIRKIQMIDVKIVRKQFVENSQ